jgi:hypothetical protein
VLVLGLDLTLSRNKVVAIMRGVYWRRPKRQKLITRLPDPHETPEIIPKTSCERSRMIIKNRAEQSGEWCVIFSRLVRSNQMQRYETVRNSMDARVVKRIGAEDRVGRIDRFATVADAIEHFQKSAA